MQIRINLSNIALGAGVNNETLVNKATYPVFHSLLLA